MGKKQQCRQHHRKEQEKAKLKKSWRNRYQQASQQNPLNITGFLLQHCPGELPASCQAGNKAIRWSYTLLSLPSLPWFLVTTVSCWAAFSCQRKQLRLSTEDWKRHIFKGKHGRNFKIFLSIILKCCVGSSDRKWAHGKAAQQFSCGPKHQEKGNV